MHLLLVAICSPIRSDALGSVAAPVRSVRSDRCPFRGTGDQLGAAALVGRVDEGEDVGEDLGAEVFGDRRLGWFASLRTKTSRCQECPGLGSLLASVCESPCLQGSLVIWWFNLYLSNMLRREASNGSRNKHTCLWRKRNAHWMINMINMRNTTPWYKAYKYFHSNGFLKLSGFIRQCPRKKTQPKTHAEPNKHRVFHPCKRRQGCYKGSAPRRSVATRV